MIPKIIHYCWLSGDPYPDKIRHCVNSWKKVIPDYEFMLWDKNTINMEVIPWVKEAYESKMYAFAADYIRLYALYNYGGIYLDSDVEVLKRFDDLMSLPYFIGREVHNDRLECAAFGAEKGLKWIKDCLEYYEGRHFLKEDGSMERKVIPSVVYETLCTKYCFNDITKIEDFDNNIKVLNIFPNNWFCARKHKRYGIVGSTYNKSSHTYCVHHFTHSWIKVNKIKRMVKRLYNRITGL